MPQNVRKHSRKQIKKLKTAIERYGFLIAILAKLDGTIIAGHGRLMAALELGMLEIPVVYVEHLTAEECLAFSIADNKLHDESTWNDETLPLVLHQLDVLGFDLQLTGFDTAESDRILDFKPITLGDDCSSGIPKPRQVVVTRLGDKWLLGPHCVICGDSLKTETLQLLLLDQLIALVFSDYPYNVKIVGHVSGKGKAKHDEFAMAAGEMSDDQFTDFLASSMSTMLPFLKDGAIIYGCMDWRHLLHLLTAATRNNLIYKNLCVWVKACAGMGSFYRNQHECVAVLKHGNAPHINNFGLGDTGRYRTNVWNYSSGSSLTPKRQQELAWHPTVKPLSLVADAIRDCSHRGDIVFDPFLGSGTTIIAADHTGRIGYGIELDPKYVDVTVRRWQERTGKQAILDATGQTFDEVAAARGAHD